MLISYYHNQIKNNNNNNNLPHIYTLNYTNSKSSSRHLSLFPFRNSSKPINKNRSSNIENNKRP